MLVLTRKVQQQLVIGDQIRITVVRIKGNTVRLGIEAPRSLRVTRAELPPSSGALPGSADPGRSAHDHPWSPAPEGQEESPAPGAIASAQPAGAVCYLAPAMP